MRAPWYRRKSASCAANASRSTVTWASLSSSAPFAGDRTTDARAVPLWTHDEKAIRVAVTSLGM